MQNTLSAWVRMSAARAISSGRMRLRVWEMASTSAPYSLWHISWMSSSGVTSPLRKGMPRRLATFLANASLKAL